MTYHGRGDAGMSPIKYQDRVQCISGCRRAGLVYAYAVSTLGRLPNQDRSFGLMLLLQTPEYSLFSAALPLLAAQSGTVTALCAFGLWYLRSTLAGCCRCRTTWR